MVTSSGASEGPPKLDGPPGPPEPLQSQQMQSQMQKSDLSSLKSKEKANEKNAQNSVKPSQIGDNQDKSQQESAKTDAKSHIIPEDKFEQLPSDFVGTDNFVKKYPDYARTTDANCRLDLAKLESLNIDKSRQAGGAKQPKSTARQSMEKIETVLSSPKFNDEDRKELVNMMKANPDLYFCNTDLKAAFLSKYSDYARTTDANCRLNLAKLESLNTDKSKQPGGANKKESQPNSTSTKEKFQCPKCVFDFHRPENLKGHMITMHQEKYQNTPKKSTNQQAIDQLKNIFSSPNYNDEERTKLAVKLIKANPDMEAAFLSEGTDNFLKKYSDYARTTDANFRLNLPKLESLDTDKSKKATGANKKESQPNSTYRKKIFQCAKWVSDFSSPENLKVYMDTFHQEKDQNTPKKSTNQQAIEQLNTIYSSPNHNDEEKTKLAVNLIKSNPDMEAAFLSTGRKFKNLENSSLNDSKEENGNRQFDVDHVKDLPTNFAPKKGSKVRSKKIKDSKQENGNVRFNSDHGKDFSSDIAIQHSIKENLDKIGDQYCPFCDSETDMNLKEHGKICPNYLKTVSQNICPFCSTQIDECYINEHDIYRSIMEKNEEKKSKKNDNKAEFLNTNKSRKAGGAKQSKSTIQQAMVQVDTVLSNPNYNDEKQNEIVVDMFKAIPDLKAAFLSKYQKMRNLSLDAPWKEIWNQKFDQLINSHDSAKPNKPEVEPEIPNLIIENSEKIELLQSTKIQGKKLKKKAEKVELAENAKKTDEAEEAKKAENEKITRNSHNSAKPKKPEVEPEIPNLTIENAKKAEEAEGAKRSKKAENEKNVRNSQNSAKPNKPEVEPEIPNLTKTQRKKLKKKAEKAKKALEAVNAEKVVEVEMAEKCKQGETAQPLQQNELKLNVEHHFMDNGKLVKKVSSSLD